MPGGARSVAARRAATATPRNAKPPDPALLALLLTNDTIDPQGPSTGAGAALTPQQHVLQRQPGLGAAPPSDPPAAGFKSGKQHGQGKEPTVQDPVDSYNWHLHAEAALPDVYDPSYHDTLYEFLFDLWPALGKVRAVSSVVVAILAAAFKLHREEPQCCAFVCVCSSSVTVCWLKHDVAGQMNCDVMCTPMRQAALLPLLNVKRATSSPAEHLKHAHTDIATLCSIPRCPSGTC